MAKQFIELKPKERILLNEVEQKVRKARNSCDYIMIKFGRKGEFMRVDFAKDQSYGFSHNLYNMEFMVRLGVMVRQYKTVNVNKISDFIFDWVNRLNR